MRLEVMAERCNGCRICENFCSLKHEGAIWPSRARIRILAETDSGPFMPNICRQCEDAACAAACPVEAIVRDEHTGAWVVSDECIGCESCIEACPYHAIFFAPELGRAFKCDLCAGEPECAAVCPAEAIRKVL
ncbi:MAG: 4Fe-4S dicluster domain-containing protein [Anaerolineae bacterium]